MPTFRRLKFPLLLSVVWALAASGCSRHTTPRPNILLIVMDAARADHFSCYGYSRSTTPNIDRVAAEGLRFSQAVSSSSWTLPAHASLFTGLLPAEHFTHTQHAWLLDRFVTLAERLKEKGYRTAAFSNNPQVDRAQNLAQGFDFFTAVWADSSVTTPRRPHNTEFTNRLVEDFLQKYSGSEKPFFIFINYMDTHTPYEPPEPYRCRFLGENCQPGALVDSANHHPEQFNLGEIQLSQAQLDTLRDIYDGALSYLDMRIGELLEFLRRRNLYDKTLIVIASDHGEIFGSWGHFSHGVLLYRPLIQIPLIIHCPALIPAPAVRQTPVAIADIFYTLAGLAGVKDPPRTGATVRDLLAAEIPTAPCYSEVRVNRSVSSRAERRHDTRSLWTPEGRHFILTEQEAFECYDLAADPEESHNLAPDPVSRETVTSTLAGFESKLLPFNETLEDLRSSSHAEIDPQQEAAIRALGYVGGGSSSTGGFSWHGREHYNNGVFFIKLRDYERARKETQMALVVDPGNRDCLVSLGKIYFHERNYSEALRHFASLMSNFPQDSEIQRLTTVLYAVNGKPAQARELFDKLVRLYPAAAEAFFHQQAGMFVDRQEPVPAVILYDLLRSKFPGNGAYEQGYREAKSLERKG